VKIVIVFSIFKLLLGLSIKKKNYFHPNTPLTELGACLGVQFFFLYLTPHFGVKYIYIYNNLII